MKKKMVIESDSGENVQAYRKRSRTKKQYDRHMNHQRKAKWAVKHVEYSSKNETDLEILLERKSYRSKGKRPMYKEYEKPAKRQECIPSRKRKRTKKTVSKCPGLLDIL
ncbi:hypothetical protein ACS0TY_036913 [Phlomoides rotata]